MYNYMIILAISIFSTEIIKINIIILFAESSTGRVVYVVAYFVLVGSLGSCAAWRRDVQRLGALGLGLGM